MFELLGYDGQQSLAIVCRDSCSEVSRLLALWVQEALPGADTHIAKGEVGEDRFHDLLIVTHGQTFYVLDPTVWQFFADRQSILVGTATTIQGALELVAKTYGGTWKISEHVTEYTPDEIQEFKTIVAQNAATA